MICVDCFLVVMPCRCTSCGSSGCAMATRFCTSTCAMSRFVPMSKVTVRLYDPSLALVDDMYNIFSTPFTCSSMGTPTVLATTCASAPGYVVVTCTVGGVICGYCSTG